LAFTLIELLVVITIVSILVAISAPSLRKARAMGRDTLCKTNLKSIYLAQSLLIDVRGRFPTLNNDPNDGNWQYNYLIYDGRDWKANFGPLITDKSLLHDVKLLYCPFQKDRFYMLDSSINPWPPNTGFDTRSSYARRHLLSGKSMSSFRKTVAILSDVIHMPRVVLSAHKTGVNAAYSDGHVTWVPDPGIFTHNEMGQPFDSMDNPIVDQIWKAMDKHQ